MSDHPELDTYDLAYICGGPARVVMVTLVTLSDDGQIKISHALHRVKAVRRAPRDQVESAILDALPEAGRTLGSLTSVASATNAVGQIGAALREQPIDSSRHGGSAVSSALTPAPEAARFPRTDWQYRRARPGIDRDTELRGIFQTPDPDLKLPKLNLNLPTITTADTTRMRSADRHEPQYTRIRRPLLGSLT